MVTVNDVTQMMFRWAPPELAMDWDNVGLLVGRGDREVHRVLVALDVSPDVVAEAAETGTDLIVSHHPVMNIRWHAQQMQTPITIPSIRVLMVMITVINDPNSQMAFWFSMIPFTSPVVMMARIPYGLPLWEVILSLAILYASFTAMVWLAAKIYRVGIFMYGKKPTFKELYKWIRYKY